MLASRIAAARFGLQRLEHQVKHVSFSCIFAEPQFDPKLARLLSEISGADIAVLDPIGETIEAGPDHYPQIDAPSRQRNEHLFLIILFPAVMAFARLLVHVRGSLWKSDLSASGNMGAPMAANLIAAGHHVTGFDIAEVAVGGMHKAQSASDAATGRDVVITMLPDGAILRRVAAEILPVMAADTLFIDCSTVDVASARAVADDAASAGVIAVDAPVSGGIAGAAAGTLTLMAGGSAAGFDRALPLLRSWGKGRALRR